MKEKIHPNQTRQRMKSQKQSERIIVYGTTFMWENVSALKCASRFAGISDMASPLIIWEQSAWRASRARARAQGKKKQGEGKQNKEANKTVDTIGKSTQLSVAKSRRSSNKQTSG